LNQRRSRTTGAPPAAAAEKPARRSTRELPSRLTTPPAGRHRSTGLARGTTLASTRKAVMHRTARSIALVAFMALGTAAVSSPAPALAQTADALQAERARLRAQLDKVNAEIDALKRAGGGVRDDYRLRARLADAESLARRLMDIEARLGIRVDSTTNKF